ncbi:MAG: hypothetical protein ACXADH_15145 [Candidatus Kariarchaeaceae archaeon]|jgi:hypothetical protein
MEDRESILYHYNKNGKLFTTPSLQISLLRNEGGNVRVDTTVNGVTTKQYIELQTEAD